MASASLVFGTRIISFEIYMHYITHALYTLPHAGDVQLYAIMPQCLKQDI